MGQRKAIVVADSAGSPQDAADTLGRLGFTTASSVDLEHAIASLRREAVDLLIVPLQGIDPLRLAALERAIRAHAYTAVIGTAPTADPDLILRAMRAGVREFLVYPPSSNDLAQAADRLVRRGGPADAAGEIIAVHSGKGGLGTTSIAVNVAEALTALDPGNRVALVDAVFSGGDVRVFLNLQPPYDMSHLMLKLDELDSDLLVSLMTKRANGTYVLTAAEDPAFDDAFDGASVTRMSQQLRSAFHRTVIDTEHHLSDRTLAILDAADKILLVTEPSVPALRSTRRSLDLFQRLGYDSTKTCVVLNRFQYGEVFTLKNIKESLGREVYASLPNDFRTVSAALNKGISVGEEDPQSKLARSFNDLAIKLRGTGTSGGDPSGNGSAPQSRLRTLFRRGSGADHVA